MRKLMFLVVIAVAAPSGPAVANGPPTQEVLVGTSPTLLPINSNTRAVEIVNHGPNELCCAIGGNRDGGAAVYSDGGATVLVDASRCLAAHVDGTPDDSWSINMNFAFPIWCAAKTAAQVHLGGTILTQLPN